MKQSSTNLTFFLYKVHHVTGNRYKFAQLQVVQEQLQISTSCTRIAANDHMFRQLLNKIFNMLQRTALHAIDVTFDTVNFQLPAHQHYFSISPCMLVVSPCSVNICGTGGSCSVIGVSSECSCYSGYSGLFCEDGKYGASTASPFGV